MEARMLKGKTTYKICDKCNNAISLFAFNRHRNACNGSELKRYNKRDVPDNLICKFCDKVCKNKLSWIKHNDYCNNNPGRKIPPTHTGGNQYTVAKKLGLPKPIVSDETKQKIIETKRNNGTLNHSDEWRSRHSDIMKNAVSNYPESYNANHIRGRVKLYEYNGVKLLGTWELSVAKWFDLHNIVWERPKNYFEYEWNGTRKYFPDFYLPKYDLYVEVKGYETDRDIAKWNVVKNLLVFKSAEIKLIKNNKFDPDAVLVAGPRLIIG